MNSSFNRWVLFEHNLLTTLFFCGGQEIISEEIIDETDQYEDNHSKRRVHRQTTTTNVLVGCVISCICFFRADDKTFVLCV